MDWLDGMGAGGGMARIVMGQCGNGKERFFEGMAGMGWYVE